MNKLKLIFAGIVISASMLTSCGSSEEVATAENSKTVEFAKTTEMLNFESSLKEWFQAKRENVSGTAKVAISTKITEDAKTLLSSIGKSEIASKSNQNTDELVREAMKAYSEKLTEMYHEQIK